MGYEQQRRMHRLLTGKDLPIGQYHSQRRAGEQMAQRVRNGEFDPDGTDRR